MVVVNLGTRKLIAPHAKATTVVDATIGCNNQVEAQAENQAMISRCDSM
jgi:hypothetical protein